LIEVDLVRVKNGISLIAIKSKKRVLAVNISLAALCERQGGRTPISNLNFYFQETKHLDMKILLCGY
jgi:hypothetical protein